MRNTPAITLRSILAYSGSNWLDPIYEWNRTVWHIELFEREQFDDLTVRKQMTVVYLNF